MVRRRTERSSERGAITLTLALGMTLLLGSAAIAIDVGHFMTVRGESQTAADLAAHAGASAFIHSAAPNIDVAVEAWATDYAGRNLVNGSPVVLLTADVGVDVVNERVAVRVMHARERGNPIPTIFGRALGIGDVDIVSRAVAEASPAMAVHCSLPLLLVDRWTESGGDPTRFDLGIDYYEAYDPIAPTSTYTGYDQSYVGTRILLEPAGGTPGDAGIPRPNWYFPFAPSALPGGPGSYQLSIESCLDPGRVYDLGASVLSDPTPMPLPTGLGLQALVNQDPTATWDSGLRCVVDFSSLGLGDPSNCRSSPRLRPAALIDPGTAPGALPLTVQIDNLAGVFIEQVFASEIGIVLTGYSGTRAARASGGGVIPPLVRTLRIVG